MDNKLLYNYLKKKKKLKLQIGGMTDVNVTRLSKSLIDLKNKLKGKLYDEETVLKLLDNIEQQLNLGDIEINESEELKILIDEINVILNSKKNHYLKINLDQGIYLENPVKFKKSEKFSERLKEIKQNLLETLALIDNKEKSNEELIISKIETVKEKIRNLQGKSDELSSLKDSLNKKKTDIIKYINSVSTFTISRENSKLFFNNAVETFNDLICLGKIGIDDSTMDLEGKIQNLLKLNKNFQQESDENELFDPTILQEGGLKQKLIKEKQKLIKIKGFNDLMHSVKKYKINKLNLQKGGSWNDFLTAMTDYHLQISQIMNKYNDFKKEAREYNILYIQLYNHKMYLMNYLNFIMTSESSSFRIIQNLSRGIVSFYQFVVDTILRKIDENKDEPINAYFYKYHYITLKVLAKFLPELYKDWALFEADEGEKNSYKLEVFKVNNPKLKNLLFILDSFKNILKDYYNKFATRVATYLRINDWKVIADTDKVFTKSQDNKTLLDNTGLKKCIQDTSFVESVSNIPFREIYDPEGFKDNATLAVYMNIPTYLSDNNSIMMITYGYSGVGKTYSIFGSSGQPGILQESLKQMNNRISMYYRAYEVYGRALPYSFYWERESKDYNHSIFAYKKDFDSPDEYKPYTNSGEGNGLLNYIKDVNTYSKIEGRDIDNFSDIVYEIDEYRKKVGRIRRTKNNKESSRSIMVYDFRIEVSKDQFVYFVLVDLPGKEDIVKTFVENPSRELLAEERREKPDGSLELECYQAKFTGYDPRIIKSMMYVNPLWLMTIPEIAKKFYQFCYKNSREFENMIWISYVPSVAIRLNDKERIFEGGEIIDNVDGFTGGVTGSFSFRNFSKKKDIKIESNEYKKFEIMLRSLELMKYLLNENKLDLINKFYNLNFFENQTEKLCKNPGNAGFEAVYINENILGLLTYLSYKVLNVPKSETIISSQVTNTYKNIMGITKPYTEIRPNELNQNQNNFLQKNKLGKSGSTIFNTELIAQTYFLRKLISDSSNKYYINSNNILKGMNEDSYLRSEYPDLVEGKKIYDFNKVYKPGKTQDDIPPIAEILQPYLEESDESDFSPNINNVYLFYVVSNMNKGKCENQMQLINDSKKFIKSIYNYKPN